MALNFRELPLTSQLALSWSFFWRGVVITIGSTILGAVLGGLFGVAVGIAVSISGGSKASIIPISQAGGFIVGVGGGLVMFYIYVRWLLSARLGQFRLSLVCASDVEAGTRGTA